MFTFLRNLHTLFNTDFIHIITNKLNNHLVFPSSIIIISSLENKLNNWVFGLFVLDVRVLYNSDLSFSDRLYGPLDVDLCRVKLHEPLSQIIQQPLLYVRDMVPKPCFQGLLNLHQVKVIYKLGQGHLKRGYDWPVFMVASYDFQLFVVRVLKIEAWPTFVHFYGLKMEAIPRKINSLS